MRTTRTVAAVCAAALLVTGTASAAPVGDPALAKVQENIDALVASGAAGVQVRVTRDGRVGQVRAGTAVLGTSVPVPFNGRFRIGSITKTFVATATLQLVAQRKLALDAAVEEYLPGLVDPRITVRQLLQHTSGLHNYTNDLPEDPQEILRTRFRHHEALDLVRAAVAKPPTGEPGAKHSYSNTNYLVVQLLIEKVTGRFWGEAVKNGVLRPLGLRDTEVPGDNPFIAGPHARGYLTTTPPVDITELNPTIAGAGGAMISTNADLDRFLTALHAGRLLAPAEQAELRKTSAASPNYGLGIGTLPTSCGQQLWGHTGGIPGYNSLALATLDGKRRVEMSITTAGPEMSEPAFLNALDAAICG
ncbi:D-alanyl-D-alanine carboxypeptidase [Crossiella equi]|uniref:D-alanyl-D-alanine carboxypeptidase n=1 Tax=Crossiella equi TaxID=130796 RepID=A0ABS5A8M4_9PSEU|nr:serine hydrolase domain-containing protein [Crossiella equi]MBP2472656.1 D-alanyl-D-alanine carboxypeptidase [Crossiella equi]